LISFFILNSRIFNVSEYVETKKITLYGRHLLLLIARNGSCGGVPEFCLEHATYLAFLPFQNDDKIAIAYSLVETTKNLNLKVLKKYLIGSVVRCLSVLLCVYYLPLNLSHSKHRKIFYKI